MTLSRSDLAVRRGGVVLLPPTLADIRHVMHNLREMDRIEAAARVTDERPEAMIHRWFLAVPLALVAHAIFAPGNREPVGLLLIIEMTAGVAEVSLIGTDRLDEVIRPLTRHFLRVLKPALLKSGLRRMECRALEGHVSARRWLKWLGAVEECEIPDGGKNGETYFQYAWRKSDVHRRTFQDADHSGTEAATGADAV